MIWEPPLPLNGLSSGFSYMTEKCCLFLLKPIGVGVGIITDFRLFCAIESNTNSWLLSWLGRGGESTFHSLVNGCDQNKQTNKPKNNNNKPRPNQTKTQTSHHVTSQEVTLSHLTWKGVQKSGNLEHSYSLRLSLRRASLYTASWIWMSINDSQTRKATVLSPCPKQATDRIQIS